MPFVNLLQTFYFNEAFHGRYFIPTIMADINYTHPFNNPNDNTVVGATAPARNNEVQVSQLSLGGDFMYENARASILLQMGTRSIVVPRNDVSPYRGQYQLANVYRYLSEAYVGYHFNKWYGINVDAGLFMSYIGLNSPRTGGRTWFMLKTGYLLLFCSGYK